MNDLQAEHKHTEEESAAAFGACVICARQVIKDQNILIAALRHNVEEKDEATWLLIDKLIDMLQETHKEYCSMKCPSVWETAKYPDGQPHTERCKEINKMLHPLSQEDSDRIFKRIQEELKKVAPAPEAEKGAVCKWTEDEESGSWDGTCGIKWTFLEDGPIENKVNFCPRCGKKLDALRSGKVGNTGNGD